MITDIHKARLLKLADFLDKVPPQRFNFASWVDGNGWEQGLLDVGCGTTACALGWATAIPEFQALGLVFQKFEIASGMPTHVRLKDDAQENFWEATVNACNFLFGLDHDDTLYLFTPDEESDSDGRLPRDASPRDVADNIRSFVRDHLGSLRE
jgi:hypothetical protein